MRKLMSLIVLLFAALSASANVTLNDLFSDHMVLQRDLPVAVFGQAAPGEKVTVSFAGQEKSVTAGQDGLWNVKLNPMSACTNSQVLTVTGQNKIEVKDVVVGDVWLCSGQSNMEWVLRNCERQEDINQANFPLLRHIEVQKRVSSHPQTEIQGRWNVCTPQSAGGFTAVGFYFGRKLQQETGIPIGLIKSAWGGTCIEPWINPEGLAPISELAKDREQLEQKFKDYRKALAESLPKIDAYVVEVRKALASNADLPRQVEIPTYPVSDRDPKGWHSLYNGMINPLVNFGIKGALWYQGESNGGEGVSYYQKMRALIGGWRKAWQVGDFPFYFVQLADFQDSNNKPEGGDGWAKLRMAQSKSLTIPRTGMAVTIDVGNPRDIHPKNKKDVGERLALWALAKDYGKKDLVYSGPQYKGMQIEGDKIRLMFDSVGSGLTVATKNGYDPMVKESQGKLQRFAIAGASKKWVWADAVIDGATVVVSSSSVTNPVAARYAFSQNPEGCNLYNNEGLPASPFRTDEW